MAWDTTQVVARGVVAVTESPFYGVVPTLKAFRWNIKHFPGHCGSGLPYAQHSCSDSSCTQACSYPVMLSVQWVLLPRQITLWPSINSILFTWYNQGAYTTLVGKVLSTHKSECFLQVRTHFILIVNHTTSKYPVDLANLHGHVSSW